MISNPCLKSVVIKESQVFINLRLKYQILQNNLLSRLFFLPFKIHLILFLGPPDGD